MTSHDQRLHSPARALLVIGQPVLVEVVKLALDHGHYTTRVAQAFDEATVALTEWRPHLAIVDMDIAGNAILDGLHPPGMRKHAIVFVDIERDQSTDGSHAVQRVEEEPLMFQRAPRASIMESRTSVR
jgi:hypothetical protein